jgi:hypothetical protein
VGRDVAGGLLVGLGAAGLGAGGALLISAELRARQATMDLSAFRAASAVEDQRLGGYLSIAIGGALVIGGVVRYAVLAARSR